MKEHRENLLQLIKMMKGVYAESVVDNKSREMSDDNSKKYISYERLLSIRELAKMFIEELNSEYLKCSKGDEIVEFIKDIIKWLQSAYDFIIENKAGSTGVKNLKVCNQSLNDYKKVYKEANEPSIIKGGRTVIATILNEEFEFGKRNMPIREQYTSNSIQPITVNVTFTGDEDINKKSADEFVKYVEKHIKELKSR